MRWLVLICMLLTVQVSIAQQWINRGPNYIALYKKTADSLLFEHTGISKQNTKKMDFPDIAMALKESYKKKIATGLVTTTKHEFLSVANKRYQYALGHRLYILQYDKKEDAEKAFKALAEAGTYMRSAPGLTYTNDFVFREGYLIYWINTACMYSFDNHMKLVNALKELIEPNHKGLLCECGSFCNEEK